MSLNETEGTDTYTLELLLEFPFTPERATLFPPCAPFFWFWLTNSSCFSHNCKKYVFHELSNMYAVSGLIRSGISWNQL